MTDQSGGAAMPTGALRTSVVRPLPRPAVLTEIEARHWGGGPQGLLGPGGRLEHFMTGTELYERMAWQQANAEHFTRSLAAQRAAVAASRNALAGLGHLWLTKVRPNGEQINLGLASCRVITNAGAAYIVDAFQNLVELENLKYHGLGTSSSPESVNDTVLGAELTTQYATNNVRATGTTGEQSGSANVYETTALVTVDAAVTVTEHGLFSRAITGGGVLFDRTVFAGVPLASGDSLQSTYQFTLIAGG